MVGYNEELWGFSPLMSIQERNFDKMLKQFFGLGIQGTTKENIQNSLDGRLKNSDLPVVVKIKTGDIEVSNIPGIQNIHEHIKSLKGENDYTRKTISHMLDFIPKKTVRYISFEDENTRGLTGAKNGQSNCKEDTWGIYAYNKGFHFEEKDEELETTRGGSHGVGKIASNAASDIHLMYFANCDENGEQHLGGTVQLIEHEYNGQFYRSTGFFARAVEEEQREKFYPYENTFHEVFEKKTRGLKIVIPYFRESYDSEEEIIRTVCDNFFVSILDGHLEVIVNEHHLTKDTLKSYLSNAQYYVQDIGEMKKVFTPLYAQTYLKSDLHIITVNNGKENFTFKLYFTYDEKIPKGRVGIVRTIGMKIEDFKVASNASKPFSAVLIGDLKEDKYLKSLENESHTQISYEHIEDTKLKAQAKRFINNLSKEIAAIIEQKMREYNPVDAEMDTSDLIYTTDFYFDNLVGTMEKVQIKDGQSVLKISSNIKGKDKGIKKGNDRPPRKTGSKKSEVKKITRKPNTEEIGDRVGEVKEFFRVNPNTVERIIIKDEEHIQFIFNENEEMKRTKWCNISIQVIDGMGEEVNTILNLSNSYKKVIELFKNRECVVADNKIKNVPVVNGQIKLKMDLQKDFNHALKFIYYIEV